MGEGPPPPVGTVLAGSTSMAAVVRPTTSRRSPGVSGFLETHRSRRRQMECPGCAVLDAAEAA